MNNDWNNYDPAPIEIYHGEALEKFHELKQFDHNVIENAINEKIGTIDGITFNNILAEFKVKIMKQYSISSNPTLKNQKIKTPIQDILKQIDHKIAIQEMPNAGHSAYSSGVVWALSELKEFIEEKYGLQ